MKLKQWYTVTEYIDVETGEVLSREKAHEDYVIYKNEKKYRLQNGIGITTIQKHCKPSKQTKIWKQ